MQLVFIVCKGNGYRNILNLSSKRLVFTLYKAYYELKRGLELASLLIFCMMFEERNFLCYIPLTDQILLSVFIYFVRYWAICVL